ncbi:MAG: 50S ribosomal protein L30 [Bacteroidales bacterium]|nr:50S ribosomal protein L30 [Bacteroidales bacterium]
MGKLKVTLMRGKAGVCERQLRTLQALGLTRRNSTVIVDDTPVFQGMIAKVKHLVGVESVK